MCIFFLKQKTAYEMLISDWSSVCSSTAGSSDILLLACTPKAASCLGQIVGIEAITLHQALGIRADGTGWRSTTKITHGLVLLEDDLRLSRPDFIEALINACPGAHIAVSYDSEQLPGPTRILAPGSTFVLTGRFRASEAA